MASGCSPTMARLLASRGITAADREEFFDSSLHRLVDPLGLPGIAEAVKVMAPFISDGREIVVFGDYDADGVCASAILVSVIRRLGGRADAFIPHRQGEGYGMTAASLARLHREHPQAALVVTVDNGITSAVEVAQLRARGIAVVVTDHHLPPTAGADGEVALPVADALVDPKVKSAPGCEHLCGAGVAFFLASALVGRLRAEAEAKGTIAKGTRFAGPLLVLAGVATVADLMPLKGQNRILVTAALTAFSACAPVGLKELLLRAMHHADKLVARDFAFLLASRLNAAGRMASAQVAYDLVMAEARETARQLAVTVDNFNALRKTQEQRMDREARAQVASFAGLEALVVAEDSRPEASPPWNSGVAGIVAARLLEDAHVPVAVVVGDHGSCRAPEGYNVRDALEAAQTALVRYGGHAAAGGFTVQPGKLEEFRRLFTAACARQHLALPDAAAILFDGWLRPQDITLSLHDEICRLEPLGEGNPEPVFGLKKVFFSEARPMGQDGRHAAFAFEGRNMPRGVWWNHGAEAEEIRRHSAESYDVLFTLTTSTFNTEQPHVELRIVDIRPSAD